jgi:beta-lactam-binding protein with PASTA domain
MAPAICPKCGAASLGADFCPGCHTYLAWEEVPAPSPPTVDPTLLAPAPSASVSLLVRDTEGGLRDADALAALRLAAGSTLTLTAAVRNDSAIDDGFTVGIEGLPPSWVEVQPTTTYLAPAGSRGQAEGDVAITIRPPRVSAARAGRWPFAVTAESISGATPAVRLRAVLTIEPFGALGLEVRPAIATGRRRGLFTCELHNLGNGDASVQLLASDAAQACAFELPAETLIAPAAATRETVGVRPMRMLWVGRSIDHRLHLQPSSREVDPPLKATPLVYRQQAWIPWWVPLLLVALAALGVALYLALPRKVTMPALIGVPTAFAAQQQLSRSGLSAHPQITTQVLARVAAGTVVGQIPHAGSVVGPSTPVSLVVAVAPATTVVPDLLGLQPAQADAVLSRVDLTLGTVSPSLNPQARIDGQLPAPGTQLQQGASVNIVLAPQTVKVPNVHGLSLRTAERRLERAGLDLGSVAPGPEGESRIASQLPLAGARAAIGATVAVTLAPRTALVPDISGMTVQAADTALETCGLKLGPLSPNIQVGQLVSVQVPRAGSRQILGLAVTAILAAKPKPGARPAPTPALPTAKQCATR